MLLPRSANCAATNPRAGNQYGYTPGLAIGIVFCALFGLSTLVHVYQAHRYRSWWTYVFAVGALTETLGWSARAYSSTCPTSRTAFLTQITTLIIAPTFYTAGIYVILGRLIICTSTSISNINDSTATSPIPKPKLNRSRSDIISKSIFKRTNKNKTKPRTSIISPCAYLWIFCTCDLLSLIVQAIGGASASLASTSNPPRSSKAGTETMVGGIIFQLFSISVFVVLLCDFLRRVRRQNPGALSKRVRLVIWATVVAVVLVYARSVYRSVELLQGWRGYLITHEGYFVGLDGVLMLLVVVLFNVLHPGRLLKGAGEVSETVVVQEDRLGGEGEAVEGLELREKEGIVGESVRVEEEV